MPASKSAKSTKVEETKDESVKVSVKTSPPVDKTTSEPPAATLTTHHELTITPPSSIDMPPKEPAAAIDAKPESPVPEPETENAAPAATSEPPSEPVQPAKVEVPQAAKTIVDPKPPSDDAPKQTSPSGPVTLSQVAGADKPADDMQSPKVFDTKQYHLPIEESHGSGSKHLVMFVVVFLILVVVGGLVAIDAGWLDLGFKLPFDIIK